MTDAFFRDCFSTAYAQARDRFIAAARQTGAHLEHHVLPDHTGAQGEVLSMDVAVLGEADAPSLVVLSSGLHGVEGFCGSGCQIALLRDQALLQLAHERQVALLLVHAINPYGFSHLRRTNEDNIDLNRNFIDFAQPPRNPRYAAVHDLMLPPEWPPTTDNERAIADYIAAHGEAVFREAVTTGQSGFADGLFYSGTAPSWSNRTLREVIRTHGASRRRIAWIDVHTGLGPYGHGEKIHAGLPHTPDNLRLTRACWGPDVVAAWEGESASQQVRGHAVSCIFEECPQAESAGIALEFGTIPYEVFIDAVRGDHWLHRYAIAAPAQRDAIKRQLRDAFYIDQDEWRGMIAGQSRVAVLQACMALGQ